MIAIYQQEPSVRDDYYATIYAMNDRPALPAPTLWYRRRLFWGIVLGVLVICSLLFFSSLIQSSQSNLELGYNSLAVLGATSFWALFFVLFGSSQLTQLGYLLYGILLLFFLHKTFSSYRVNIIYPSIIIINLFMSTILLYIGLSSL